MCRFFDDEELKYARRNCRPKVEVLGSALLKAEVYDPDMLMMRID